MSAATVARGDLRRDFLRPLRLFVGSGKTVNVGARYGQMLRVESLNEGQDLSSSTVDFNAEDA